MTLTWKDIVPDVPACVIPVLAGVPLLTRAFSWTVLVLVIALLITGFAGNAFVQCQRACCSCKQREIGYPAEQILGKPGKPQVSARQLSG